MVSCLFWLMSAQDGSTESISEVGAPEGHIHYPQWLGDAECIMVRRGKLQCNMGRHFLLFIGPFCFRLQLKHDGTWWCTRGGSEGETGEWSGYPIPFTLPRNMVYPALLLLMRTPRLPVVGWTDVPCRFKWTHLFHRNTKSCFCTCAITFHLASTTSWLNAPLCWSDMYFEHWKNARNILIIIILKAFGEALGYF